MTGARRRDKGAGARPMTNVSCFMDFMPWRRLSSIRDGRSAGVFPPKKRGARLAPFSLRSGGAPHRCASLLAQRGVTPEEASPRDLDRLLGSDAVHQGVALETEQLPPL